MYIVGIRHLTTLLIVAVCRNSGNYESIWSINTKHRKIENIFERAGPKLASLGVFFLGNSH